MNFPEIIAEINKIRNEMIAQGNTKVRVADVLQIIATGVNDGSISSAQLAELINNLHTELDSESNARLEADNDIHNILNVLGEQLNLQITAANELINKINKTPVLLSTTDPLTYILQILVQKSGGSGYSIGDTLSINGVVVTVTSVIDGAISSFSINDPSKVYTDDPAGKDIETTTSGEGVGAIFDVITRYAPGDTFRMGILEFSNENDPMTQESGVHKMINDAFDNASVPLMKGYYGNIAPTSGVVLKAGMLFLQSDSDAAPDIEANLEYAVKRYNGSDWESIDEKYTVDINHSWINVNIEDNNEYYYSGSGWAVKSFSTDLTLYAKWNQPGTFTQEITFNNPKIPTSGSIPSQTASPTAPATKQEVYAAWNDSLHVSAKLKGFAIFSAAAGDTKEEFNAFLANNSNIIAIYFA